MAVEWPLLYLKVFTHTNKLPRISYFIIILEEEYKESYESYDATMNFLTEDQTLQSHILVALAAITYLFNEVEDAKILLFRR